MDVFEALTAEYAALGSVLAVLDEGDWMADSACSGWSVADVVLHLAQTEEGVLVSTGARASIGSEAALRSRADAPTIDDFAAQLVAAERGAPPAEIFARWQAASSACIPALRNADPSTLFAWATNPLKARTIATTRLSEHWIHANDIARPLGIPYPDSERLWHIARLAHRTVPYAYARAGRDDAPTVRLELLSPDEEMWYFGSEDAECVVTGSASEFCRIAARRLPLTDAATIVKWGARTAEMLTLVRTYA